MGVPALGSAHFVYAFPMRVLCRLLLLLIAFGASAQLHAADKLVIGTREAPPFAMKNSDGEWSGLSIDLWQEVARRLELNYEFKEMGSPETLIAGVANGTLDASISAITVTADRAELVDFTQPYYNSGLGIVVPTKTDNAWWAMLAGFFSIRFLEVIAVLVLVLLSAGFGVWFFERKANAEQFGGSTHRGLAAAFWWSAVTMTTVGYGDKAPQTIGGRAIALIWMFTSVIIISSFTAQIATSLTINTLNSAIHGPADLPRFKISTVGNSTAAHFLTKRHVPVTAFNTIEEALKTVASGQADACVYDAAIIKYYLRKEPKLSLLPASFDPRDYAIALPLNSPLRKSLNITLLEIEQSDLWPLLRHRHLGDKD